MSYRFFIILIVIIFNGCIKQPVIIPEEIIDLTYDELKTNYKSCIGKGIMMAKGEHPWKLNYSFFTQNDSSFIQFRDVFGRRVLFVQALPSAVKLWDMQKNIQYYPEQNNSVPILDLVDSYDIAQILWGEIPVRFTENTIDSGFERDSNVVNFNLSGTKLGMVLDKVTFNIDSANTIIDFKISDREYGKFSQELLKGIPENVPNN